MTSTAAESIPAALLLDEIHRCGVRTVLTVPDTHQATLITAIQDDPSLRLVTCATEDEATAIAAGLWIGGDEPMLLIQNTGLCASVNTLRGVAIDGRIPLFSFVGLFSREPDRAPRDSARSPVRYAIPLLDAFGVPYELIEGRADLPRIAELFHLSRERRGPAVAFIGLPTA